MTTNISYTHRIYGTGRFTYILPYKSTIHVGKYTSPMDATGYQGINQTGGWKPSHPL